MSRVQMPLRITDYRILMHDCYNERRRSGMAPSSFVIRESQNIVSAIVLSLEYDWPIFSHDAECKRLRATIFHLGII